MYGLSPETKRTFLVVSSNTKRVNLYSEFLNKHVPKAKIFTAADGKEGVFKAQNVPPDVVITDLNLPLISGFELIRSVLKIKKVENISIIAVSEIPDKEHFVDEVVTGQLQILTQFEDELSFCRCLNNALNNLEPDKGRAPYKLRFISAKDVLFREGEAGECVYIVKRGELAAYKGKEKSLLGNVKSGEFVGEMSHINEEQRSATVVALTDCELIEIPNGTLDFVLFSKPAWAKALVKTLSRRLRDSNSALIRVG